MWQKFTSKEEEKNYTEIMIVLVIMLGKGKFETDRQKYEGRYFIEKSAIILA